MANGTKNKKSLMKRIKITGTGKILKRPPGQNHFNAKNSGNTTRERHGQVTAPKAMTKITKALIN